MISRKILAGVGVMAAGVIVGAAIPTTIGGTAVKPEAKAAVPSQPSSDSDTQDPIEWDVNSLGQTYGDFTAVTDPSEAPDLVSVWVTPDLVGYIPSEYVFPDYSEMTPAELSVDGLARASLEPTVVPATDADGNVIGEFSLG